ncbi:SRPBCC domain-containing protein [Arthrobacter russicus]|uniref:Uncharacterized protein YndB with AHSA1/START domain n=1 Tax=Arthrobacter russicus TaxID=172040 RepID=A0ABU1JFW9_9MICC|nr:SRPBCC domain-containing protein [Arthrobacter russicus]MDR6271019.1 uncharacterized protein YndB with AHSA1/START domain [Arthrobacter russicus]
MGFPNHIERTIEVPQSPEQVWTAITSAEGLGSWFGNRATVDLRVGGLAQVDWDEGSDAELRIERLEEPNVFGYTWRVDEVPADNPQRTYVEFSLTPIPGGTRIHVVESGFAQLAQDLYDKGFASHTEGWPRELGELVDYLNAA